MEFLNSCFSHANNGMLLLGTHVARTGELRPFKITGQTSVALGIRRIEAVAAEAADQWYDGQYAYLTSLGRILEVNIP